MTASPERPVDGQRRFYNVAYSPDRPLAREGLAFRSLRRFELHRTDAIFRLLPRGGLLLDVGCGDGAFALRCVPFFDHVTGIDVADTQVEIALERASLASVPNATFLRANLDAGLPFPDQYFDAVTAIAVLAMVFDPVAAVGELRRKP